MSESVTRCVNFKWPSLTIQAILILTGDIGGLLEGLLGFSWDPLGVGLGSVGSPLGFNGGQFGVQ